MNSRTCLLLLLVVGVVHLAPTDDVTHEQAVENAIAEAEHDDAKAAAVVGDLEETPETTDDDPTPPEENPDEEPPPEVPSDDPPPVDEIPPPESEDPANPGDVIPEGEILSLPHLPDPKYDEEGDFVWFPRIIGGSRAALGEFPSKVSLQSRFGSHFCGGSLITSNHILSAAHCVVSEEGRLLNPASVEVMAGDISITNNAGPFRVHRIVSHIFVHPEYDPHTMANDVAMLRVSIPFQLVEGVLTTDPLSLGVPVTGTACQLAGWGATNEGSNNASPNLMRVNLEIIDNDRCNKSYQGMVGANMFCAGTMSGGRDACQGDSGGGLICNGVITGIVSFGFGCGRPRFPGVYMDVSAYNEFIEGALNFEGNHEDIPQPDFLPGGGAAATIGVHVMSLFSLVAVILCLNH